ncbi:ABC transporter permease [Rhodococcus sp. ZPP]|uniref:ABC transporter permease n=1 Tax=Rhodococcus sp. ZPP TaxID=2749906 RepID=UPI001AD865C4|nr:ABC transporter permease [Rhodococcus sp. ZPP]QTJ68729.1 ABC transporter permease [Rhodococcus sp. ZPP]
MTALLTAEFRKVTTLRFWWMLGLTPLVVGMFSSAISLPVLRAFTDAFEADPADANLAATVFGLAVALSLVVLFAALFGAVNAGTEFRYKTLTTTFLTARGRDGVIGAKLAVTAAFGFFYCLVVEMVSVALLLTFGGENFALRGSLFAMLAAALVAAACWALIGGGMSMLTGSSVGSCISLVVWYTLGEMILRSILSGIGIGAVGDVLPVSATLGSVANAAAGNDIDWLPLWPAAPIAVVVWTALFTLGGWALTRSRDIT